MKQTHKITKLIGEGGAVQMGVYIYMIFNTVGYNYENHLQLHCILNRSKYNVYNNCRFVHIIL